jgi:aerobic carbon-monoxide dehydrogenase large subunit
MVQPILKPVDNQKRNVGSPKERVEDLRLLRGKGIYVDDVKKEDVLHVSILRSSIAHGVIKNINVDEARKLSGVIAVLTSKEIIDVCGGIPKIPIRLHHNPTLINYMQPVIAFEKVRFVGEAIALVVAKTPAIAEDALALIELDIESLDVAADIESSKSNIAKIFDDSQGNSPLTYRSTKGNAQLVFDNAAYTRKEKFVIQRISALTMETRGVLAQWKNDAQQLFVFGAAKVPFWNRAALATMLGMEKEQVQLIENDVGGSFGARGEFYTEDFLIPFAAKYLRVTVKWIEDRLEHLMSMNQARDCEAEIEIACDREGKILGFRGHIDYDLGAYPRTNGLVAPRNITQFLTGPYKVENVDITCDIVFTNKTPSGTLRAPGRFESNFFSERLIELAAKDLNLDPVLMRRKNVLTPKDMPYPFPTINPSLIAHTSDTECDSGDYRETLDRCVKEFKWRENEHLQGQLIDGVYHGLGMACFIEGGSAGPRENAKLFLEKDGRLTFSVGSTSVGQGVETVLTQIAADELDVEMTDIVMLHGSTTLLNEGWGSYHSRSTVMGGSAVMNAAELFKEEIKTRAGVFFKCDAALVEVTGGKALSPKGLQVSWNDLVETQPIEVMGSFASHHHTYAYGCAAAHVTVDPKTGRVQILDYLVVEDVGRAINPLTVHGQLVGGTVQGLGGIFLEHVIHDSQGQLLTGSLADYLIPTATDFPVIRAIVLEQYPSPLNPLGAKGAGEGGTICVGGAIANAVANALSAYQVKPNSLPLSPMRVWGLIHEE